MNINVIHGNSPPLVAASTAGTVREQESFQSRQQCQESQEAPPIVAARVGRSDRSCTILGKLQHQIRFVPVLSNITPT